MQRRNKTRQTPLLFVVLVIACVMANAQAKFTDVTAHAGISHQFAVYEGMFGGGACVIDINNDGFEDLFLTGGMNDDALYLNNGDGTFRNIFEASGLLTTKKYVTQGACGADVNRDGWTDLFVTTITARDSIKKIPRAENLLFLNTGKMTFVDVTESYGLRDLQSFSTGVSFGDFNLDGYPDAYVGNYFIGYEGTLSQINDATIVGANQTAEGYLLKNVRGKYFEDVYDEYGLSFRGFGFGAVFTDFDRDGDPDILVNHDFGYKATPNVALENRHPRRVFGDITREKNFDLKINAMGTAVGDFNNDGSLDYYITNIRFNRFMVNGGAGRPFTDRSKELGMDYVSISWGANFADFDQDMDVDLFVANGDLNPNDVPLPDFYFENAGGKFKESAAAAGLNDYGIGRGSVVFDLENDGDLDILVVNQKPVLDYPVNSVTHLYRNDTPQKGNWLKVRLKGMRADLLGLGARVDVVAGNEKMVREIDGGSSHLSQNSVIAHFGMGANIIADSLIVTWPGGNTQLLLNQRSNTLITITEDTRDGDNILYPLAVGAIVVVAAGAIYRLRRKRAATPSQNSS